MKVTGDGTHIITTESGDKVEIQGDMVISVEDRFTEFEKAVYDGLQQAFKVTCNSLYGQVGASTSKMCFKPLAASTTAVGRQMIITARDEIEKTYPGATTIYGDTDSVFVDFAKYIESKHGTDLTIEERMQYSMDYSIEAGEHVTSLLKEPQELEREKQFYPFIIFSKKRYVGNKYEYNITDFKQTSMGIVLKRRDNAPATKEIYGGIINILLNKCDMSEAVRFFQKKIGILLRGEMPFESFIITKSIRTGYADPTKISHKMLADRMYERDPGNKVQCNTRIPFLYIDDLDLECALCQKVIDPDNGKCVVCMKLYCPTHIDDHRSICVKKCRFCKTRDGIKRCNTCKGYYCSRDMVLHTRRKDKMKRLFYDKCKNPLKKKILQGDITEHPDYIRQNDLHIDYKYYLDHQVKKPCMQLFGLEMENPKELMNDAIQTYNNRRQQLMCDKLAERLHLIMELNAKKKHSQLITGYFTSTGRGSSSSPQKYVKKRKCAIPSKRQSKITF